MATRWHCSERINVARYLVCGYRYVRNRKSVITRITYTVPLPTGFLSVVSFTNHNSSEAVVAVFGRTSCIRSFITQRMLQLILLLPISVPFRKRFLASATRSQNKYLRIIIIKDCVDQDRVSSKSIKNHAELCYSCINMREEDDVWFHSCIHCSYY